MYARGRSVREIGMHLEELYGIDVSPDLISAVTNAMLEEVAEWRNRPRDTCYPLVFLDAIRVKIRDEGFVRNKAVHIALGILPDGTKDILGLWIEQTENAGFWLRVMNERKARGLGDILVAVVSSRASLRDALPGNGRPEGGSARSCLKPSPGRFAACGEPARTPEAINAVFPDAVVQTCIVHLIRHSMNFASRKDRKQVGEGAQGRLPGQGRRCSRLVTGRLRGRPVGYEIPRDRPRMAAEPGSGHPVLRISRGYAPDHLHHERHRGAELEAATGGARTRPLPQ